MASRAARLYDEVSHQLRINGVHPVAASLLLFDVGGILRSKTKRHDKAGKILDLLDIRKKIISDYSSPEIVSKALRNAVENVEL